MAQSKTGFDSLGREWKISMVEGWPTLTPIGHDTDPDSHDLSVDDERKLLTLVETDIDENSSDDHLGHLYDKARSRCVDIQMGL